MSIMFEIDLDPVDKIARVVTSKGIHFSFKPQNLFWIAPPESLWLKFPGPRKDNLVGKVFDRLIVISYYGKTNSKHKSGRWIVRCTCGIYEMRKTRTLKKTGRERPQMCQFCNKLQSLKWKGQHHGNHTQQS